MKGILLGLFLFNFSYTNGFENEILEDYYQYESAPELFKHDIDFFGEQDKIMNKHTVKNNI